VTLTIGYGKMGHVGGRISRVIKSIVGWEKVCGTIMLRGD